MFLFAFLVYLRSYNDRSEDCGNISRRNVGTDYDIVSMLIRKTTFYFWGPWPLKMGPKDCPETSVTNYYYTLRNSSEERSSHLYVLRSGSLKSFFRQFAVRMRQLLWRCCLVNSLFTRSGYEDCFWLRFSKRWLYFLFFVSLIFLPQKKNVFIVSLYLCLSTL
jgi:hypothetical protein